MSHAYGGVCLHQMAGASGGVHDTFRCGHIPKRELADRMHAFLDGIECERQRQFDIQTTRIAALQRLTDAYDSLLTAHGKPHGWGRIESNPTLPAKSSSRRQENTRSIARMRHWLTHAAGFPAANRPKGISTMSTLMQASAQWANRPADERFTSLHEMSAKMHAQRAISKAAVVSSRRISAMPTDDNTGLMIQGPKGNGFAPTHHAFGQLATLAGAPAGYLRKLPAPVAADCLNYGFHVAREVEDIGVLLTAGDDPCLRAATGPAYGRIWNSEVVDGLIARFGDGVSGAWRVPGEFGKHVEITKANTTLYAGDRDMFVFLCDETNRIDMPNRRDGKAGSLARGFFVWNSEVGSATLGIKAFLFDYVCCNRIVWGAQELGEVNIRHTAKAPDRWIEEIEPVLLAYSNGSASKVSEVIERAQANKVDKMADFLAKRFGPRVAPRIIAAHEFDEGRPPETAWDAVTAVTAYARGVPFMSDRVELETEASKILEMA